MSQLAYDVFLQAHGKQYRNRIAGNADRSLTSAIGVCTYWLMNHRDMSFSDFMNQFDQLPIRNLGPRRIELVKKYFHADQEI